VFIVLDHHHDRSLVDGEVTLWKPVFGFAICVIETVFAPYRLANTILEVAHKADTRFRCVGNRRNRCGRGDHTGRIIVGVMGALALGPRTRRPPRTLAGAVAFTSFWIRFRIGNMDLRVIRYDVLVVYRLLR